MKTENEVKNGPKMATVNNPIISFDLLIYVVVPIITYLCTIVSF